MVFHSTDTYISPFVTSINSESRAKPYLIDKYTLYILTHKKLVNLIINSKYFYMPY